MRPFIVQAFKGSVPRRAAHLTPVGEAAVAMDCRLWHGTLESWREPLQRFELASTTKTSYETIGCCLLESSTCAHFAEGAAETRHVFATGYNGIAHPVRLVLDDTCTPTVLRLGLPCPENPPVADTAATTPGKGHAPRQYLYVYKDRFGNRSAASAPSNNVIVGEGQAVMVSGWSVPTTWDIQAIEIYRTVVGFESVIKEGENTLDATWMLVGEVPPTATSFTDTKHNADLTEALEADVVEPPPEGLTGITWVQSMNCLAGFVGRELWFSENNHYHNWRHKILLDDTIRAIVESNEIIYVATDGPPYVVPGAVDCKDAGCRKAIRHAEGLPLVGSGHRSMVGVPSGAVYPTHDGIVYLSGNRPPIILTSAFYAPDDWQRLHPETAKLAYHMGRLYCFARNGAFCLSLRDGATTASDLDAHTSLSLRPLEVWASRTGRLLLHIGNNMVEWDRGVKRMPHHYVLGSLLFGTYTPFGAAQVTMHTGSERVRIECDGMDVFDETLAKTEDFALPRWTDGLEYKVTLTGTATVKRFSMAASTKELS